MTLVHRTSDGNGGTIRSVPVTIFWGVTVFLLSTLGATWTWGIAQWSERARFAQEIGVVVDKKLADFWERHSDSINRLQERIAETRQEVGKVDQKIEDHKERQHSQGYYAPRR